MTDPSSLLEGIGLIALIFAAIFIVVGAGFGIHADDRCEELQRRIAALEEEVSALKRPGDEARTEG